MNSFVDKEITTLIAYLRQIQSNATQARDTRIGEAEEKDKKNLKQLMDLKRLIEARVEAIQGRAEQMNKTHTEHVSMMVGVLSLSGNTIGSVGSTTATLRGIF